MVIEEIEIEVNTIADFRSGSGVMMKFRKKPL
jgi:hypothetical protein